jgi:hypothetical protein
VRNDMVGHNIHPGWQWRQMQSTTGSNDLRQD